MNKNGIIRLWHGTDREFKYFDIAYAGTSEAFAEAVGITLSTSFDDAVRAIRAAAKSKERSRNLAEQDQELRCADWQRPIRLLW